MNFNQAFHKCVGHYITELMNAYIAYVELTAYFQVIHDQNLWSGYKL